MQGKVAKYGVSDYIDTYHSDYDDYQTDAIEQTQTNESLPIKPRV